MLLEIVTDIFRPPEAKLLQVESFYRRLEGEGRTVGVDEEKTDILRKMMEERMKSEFELKVVTSSLFLLICYSIN